MTWTHRLIHLARRTDAGRFIACVCAIGFAATGCEPAKTPPPSQLPRFAELEPMHGDPNIRTRLHGDADAIQHVFVQKLLFDHNDDRVDLALASLNPPDTIPADKLDAWRANGLHIAAVTRDQFDLLQPNLPERVAQSNQVIYPSAHFGSVDLADHADRRQPITHTDTEGGTSETRYPTGTWRLLARLHETDDATDSYRLELLPQHHSHSVILPPESPDQRLHAGNNFEALHLNHPIPRQTAWLIWCDVPPPPEPPPTSQPAESPEQTEPTDPNERDSKTETGEPAELQPARKPRKPIPLGRAMLSGKLRETPVRIVLLVTTRTAVKRNP